MNPERPASIRTLLARLGGVLLGAFALYVLGAGPKAYYDVRVIHTLGFQGSRAVFSALRRAYAPLEASVEGTPFQAPFTEYCDWWERLAAKKYPPPSILNLPPAPLADPVSGPDGSPVL
jgi:hypothetical protein